MINLTCHVLIHTLTTPFLYAPLPCLDAAHSAYECGLGSAGTARGVFTVSDYTIGILLTLFDLEIAYHLLPVADVSGRLLMAALFLPDVPLYVSILKGLLYGDATFRILK